MPSRDTDKRKRLIEAAGRLIHRQGFNRTTLVDIATEADVPLGNIYYYFKTKEEIGNALIGEQTCSVRGMFDRLNELPEPRQRVSALIAATAGHGKRVAQSGCPIGGLCQELNKEGGVLADKAAGTFTLMLSWLEEQFRLMGTGKSAADHALHLVSALQGASLLTNTFGDPELMRRETARLTQWINGL